MKTDFQILVVDNHHLFLQGVVGSLNQLGYMNVETALTCDEAYKKLKAQLFDVLLTDLSFDNNQTSPFIEGGEALIRAIKDEGIKVKTLVLSGHSETNRVYSVIKNLNPDGYLLKNSCETSEIGFAIQKIMNNEIYYSHDIHQKILRRSIIGIQLDEVALQILKELPKHPKISNLEGIIKKANGSLLKLRSIETKLSNLRVDLNANNNADLILKAKELGIID